MFRAFHFDSTVSSNSTCGTILEILTDRHLYHFLRFESNLLGVFLSQLLQLLGQVGIVFGERCANALEVGLGTGQVT